MWIFTFLTLKDFKIIGYVFLLALAFLGMKMLAAFEFETRKNRIDYIEAWSSEDMLDEKKVIWQRQDSSAVTMDKNGFSLKWGSSQNFPSTTLKSIFEYDFRDGYVEIQLQGSVDARDRLTIEVNQVGSSESHQIVAVENATLSFLPVKYTLSNHSKYTSLSDSLNVERKFVFNKPFEITISGGNTQNNISPSKSNRIKVVSVKCYKIRSQKPIF